MLFNLKEAAEHGVNIGTKWSLYPQSSIGFEEPQTSEQQIECVERMLLLEDRKLTIALLCSAPLMLNPANCDPET